MSLGKRLFIGETAAAAGACSADSVNPFDDGFTSSKALYQFDGNANDTAGSYNATASSGVTYTSGYIGQAATMGGNDSINTNDGGALLGENWSISFFVKFNNANDYEYIAANWRSNPTPRLTSWYLLKRNSTYGNVLEFNVYGSNGTDANYRQFIAPSSSAFTSNTWYHIAISFGGLSATDVGMYINGLPVSYTTSTGGAWDGSAQINTLDTTIGGLSNSSGGGNYLDGQIDQVRFFNKAISDAEAAILGNETTDTASDVNVLNDGSGVALYSLDYDASDASGNYDGTPSNVEFGVDGEINWGASFNGSSSKITLPTGSPFDDSNTIKCISGWVKADTTTSRVYLYSQSSSTNANDYFYVGYLGDLNAIYLGIRDGSASNQTNRYVTITPNTNWNHIVAQLNGSTVEIWLNGVQQTVNETSSGTATSSSWIDYPNYDSSIVASIGIFRAVSPDYSLGQIDQVRIFNKALSSSEVSTLYGENACVYTSTTDTLDYQGTNAAYYKLDGNALDETSNNNDGTETDITYEFGRYGSAAKFDGSNSIIKDVLGSGFTYAGKTMTFSAWIFVEDASNDNMIIGDGLATSTGGWGISTGYGNAPNRSLAFSVASAAMGGVQQTYSSVSVSDNTWTHIVVSVDFSSITNSVKMYINGTEDTSITEGITGTTFVDNTTYNTAIGGTWTGSAGRLFEGKIDQVRIYNSALDATAVENLYNEKQAYITKDASDPFGDGDEEAFYKLENNANDSTGSNNGAASDVTFTSGSGLFGTYAADFNGSSSDIEINKSVFGTGDGTADVFTISLWFNTTTNNGVLAGTRGNSSSQGFALWLLSDGTIRYDEANATGSTDTLITTRAYDDGNWHNVVVTRNASNQATLCVDGSVQVATKTISTPLTSHTNNLFIGRYTGGSLYYDGSIDQVRIFNRALDGDEVFKLYAEVIN